MMTCLSQPFRFWHEPWNAAVSPRLSSCPIMTVLYLSQYWHWKLCNSKEKSVCDYFLTKRNWSSLTWWAWHLASCLQDPSSAWHTLGVDIHENLNQFQPRGRSWDTSLWLCSLHQHGHHKIAYFNDFNVEPVTKHRIGRHRYGFNMHNTPISALHRG